MAKIKILLAVLLACLPVAVLSAPKSEVVCSIEIDKVEVFKWVKFRDGRGLEPLQNGDRQQLYIALKRELVAHSLGWPIDFSAEVFARFEALEQGKLVPADWKREKAERPPNSLNFQGAVFGGASRIWLPTGADEDECKESQAMREARAQFANFVELVALSIAKLTDPSTQSYAKGLAVIEQEFDAYLFEGFPMFPWEAAVNSWFLTDAIIANGPPKWQLAFLHPSAGVIGNVESNTNGDIGTTLLIEPIGVVRYTRNYKHWFGASLMAAFPFDREPGIGFALNYDQFKLGVTWHDDASGNYDGAAVFLGIELYQFFGSQTKKYDGYKNRVKDILKKKIEKGSGG